MVSPAPHAPPKQRSGTLVLTRDDVRRLLDVSECIDAVERAFLLQAGGQSIAPAVLATPVPGGGFHVKTAGILGAEAGARPLFAAKVNANFPANPSRRGLPTIQGLIALFDAVDGRPLALLDSIEITSARTAAATAVAAKFLAREDAEVVTVCGCGEQARHQLRALTRVRRITDAMAFDVDPARADVFAAQMSTELGIAVTAVRALDEATRRSDVWITCTPARRWFLGRAHVAPGAFIAAVGADNPEKQEIEPELLATSVVVADILDQCATMGDLYHALHGGVMRREDVYAELAEVVSGQKPGRRSADQVIVFDSTGTALEDVAAVTLVYERALAGGDRLFVDLNR